MIDKLRRTSPAQRDHLRRRSLDSAAVSGGVHQDHAAKPIRRRRLELRRLKAMCKKKSRITDDDISDFNAGKDKCFEAQIGNQCEIRLSKYYLKKKPPHNQKHGSDRECCEERSSKLVLSSIKTASPENEIGKSGASSSENESYRETSDQMSLHGVLSVIGRRREMEDAVAIELGFLTKNQKQYDFYGVYDGHGGSLVAEACREMLHRLLMKIVEGVEEERKISNEDDSKSGDLMISWDKVLRECFLRMDEEVNKLNGAAVATMGSTAVVAVVGEEEVVVANCGDSRAVLSRGGAAVPLSNDHKPDRSDELKRIEATGGKVIDWNGQRVLGVLSTSRSIGDRYLKPYIIPEPEVKVSERSEEDEFLILASDGLWDVVSNELACQVARRCLRKVGKRTSTKSESDQCDDQMRKKNGGAEAAAMLAELAIARGSKDNISIIVIDLSR